MRALITGAAGFVAKHLARELSSSGWSVDGCGIEHGSQFPEEKTFQRLTYADVTDRDAMRAVIEEASPDVVFHLAGVSTVAGAEHDPGAAFRSNCQGAVVVARELSEQKKRNRRVTLLIVGSGEQYGAHPADRMPLPEEARLLPLTTYAASKCAQEIVALQVQRASGLRVICVRSFNHSGGGQRTDFLLPALVQRVLELRRSGGNSLAIGNTSPVRDYLHVEDVVRAYKLLVEHGEAGSVYNVSSGIGLSVEQIANRILEKVGVRANLEVKAEFVRPVDIPVLIGSNEKLRRATGWEPVKSFDDIVEDLILAAS